MPELTKIQTGLLDAQGPFHIEDGHNGAPGIAFEGDTDTGLTRSADGEISVVSNATTRFKTNTNSLHVDFDHPVIQPTLNFDFANTKALDPRINFRRDSIATYVGADGLIKTAGVGEPRFDHDPLTGECLGLLMERGRTNVLGNSQNLTDNNGNDWDNVNGVIATNQTTAPDGTTTAASFTASAGNAEHSVVFAELVPQGSVSVSIWIKPNTYSIVSFVLYGEANSTVSYNLSTKTVYNQLSNVSAASITEYPNGWYRIVATMNCSVANSRVFRLFAGTGNFSASGTESFYYWGPQLESGSYATSYIPTTESNVSVTRGQDHADMFDSNISSWFNESGGTITFDFNPKQYVPTTDGARLFKFDNSNIAGDTRIDYVISTSGSYQPYLAYGGSSYYGGASSIGFTKDTEFKIALTIKENDIVGYINGSQSLNDTTMTMFMPNRFLIGSNGPNGGSSVNGYIRNMKYYSRRLSNDYLSYITS